MIYEVLAAGNTSLASRKNIIEKLIHQPNLIPTLVDFTFDVGCKVKVIASVILDDLVQVNNHALDHYIEKFIQQLYLVEDESVKRLTSKMSVLLLEKKRKLFNPILEEQLLNQSLVWLTSTAKVATEANAMQIVRLLAAKFPEHAKSIAEVVEVRFSEKTPAYQSQARKLLKTIRQLD